MLPPQTSPCRNTDAAAGTPCDLTRSSACCSRGVVGIRPRRRSAARSSTAHGRERRGRSACDSRIKAWTLAIAAPASRSRAAETIGGRSLLPDRKVSRVATVPLALPSRSAAIRRGPARPWVSASRRARALVITMPSVVQRGTESFRIRSVAPVDVPSTRRRNVPEGRWVLREGFSTETTRIPPTTPATQRRTCSLGNAAGRADGDIAGMCAYLLSEDKGCRAVCEREALAQTSFRSRSRCACSSGLSTLSSAVTTSRAWPNGRQAAFPALTPPVWCWYREFVFDWCPHAESG